MSCHSVYSAILCTYMSQTCVRYSIIYTCVWCMSDRLLLPLRDCFSKWCTESMCEQMSIPAELEFFFYSSLELEQPVTAISLYLAMLELLLVSV